MEAALFSAVVNSLKAAVMTHVSGSGRGLFFRFFLSNSKVEYSVSRNLVRVVRAGNRELVRAGGVTGMSS